MSRTFKPRFGFGRVGTPEVTVDSTLQVASLDDLMATKLKVILQRAEAKDYRDLAAMIQPSGLFGYDFPVLPNIDRCAIHTCGLARLLGGSPQRATDRLGKLVRLLLAACCSHGPFSINRGESAELSYTAHVSAIGL